MKICFKCNTKKDISEFYKHSKMKDGFLNKCKECCRSDTKINYRKDPKKYQIYDKKRQSLPERRERKIHYTKKHRDRYPDKYKARQTVANSLKNGKIKRSPCCICGSVNNLQAHHDDYNDPLNIIWYCDFHHRTTHGKER